MYDDLFMFIKLIELGSFSKTAKFYKTTQPTVTRRIIALEDKLGVRLVDRDARVFQVTSAGLKIFKELSNSQTQIDSTLNQVKCEKQNCNTRLRVAFPPTLAFHNITLALGDFLKQNPDISLNIFYQKEAVDLIKQDLDLAISSTLPLSETDQTKLLYKINFQLFASKKYVAENGAPKTIADLAHHTVVGLIHNDGTIDKRSKAVNLKTGLAEYSDNSNVRILTNDALNTHKLVTHGYAIGGGWDSLFFDKLASGEYIKILPDYVFGEIPCYLFTHPKRKSKALNKLLELLENCFQDSGFKN